ncbi:unnamed protein product [Schistosoma guineensis]|nr:unnamed protein product [Schistosoma guineensis]
MMITAVIISLLLFQSFQSTTSNQSNTTTTPPSAWEKFKSGLHVFLDFLCTLNSFWQTVKSIFGYIF